MKTRYVVHHGFYHTFGKETQPTWITRENADLCADIPPAERGHLIDTGVITAVQNAPSVDEQPTLSMPDQPTSHAPPVPGPSKHSTKREK